MPHRPDAAVFDGVETLFSLDAVGAALDRTGVGPGRLDTFFARILRDAFASSSVGGYRRFVTSRSAPSRSLVPSWMRTDAIRSSAGRSTSSTSTRTTSSRPSDSRAPASGSQR